MCRVGPGRFQHLGACLHPGLAVEVADPELATGRVGHHLVMLLQNLVGALQSTRASVRQKDCCHQFRQILQAPCSSTQ